MITPEQRTSAEIIRKMLSDGLITVPQANELAHTCLRDRRPYRAPRPLMEAPRYRADADDSDYWSEYGWMPEWVATDEDAMEWCDCNCLEIHSMWDCTGLTFTLWIDWHRNPCGRYTYIHHMGRDV